MVIDKIGNINNIVDTKNTKPVSRNKSIDKSDSVQISSEAKNAAEQAKISQIVKDTPDVRTEKVRDIKTRIAEGTYDKFDDNKVLEMVAEKIATQLLR
ncbi:MAG: flagellar biosynthesis anti-sigma factor FlgM [Spirochaetota bacterium]